MSGLISVITTPFNIGLKLLDLVKKYQKKKRTETRFIHAFEDEIERYIDIVKKIFEISEKSVYPLLDRIENELTVHQMNEILASLSDMPLIYAELVKAFINFTKACREVSFIKGFMDDLRETDVLLYDFVLIMKEAYLGDDKVKIQGSYYRFFQTYKDEIFKEVKITDLDEVVDKLKRYITKIKHYVNKTAMIKRSIRKKYMKNFRILMKETEKVIVKPSSIVDLKVYIPEKLLPITVLIEELSM